MDKETETNQGSERNLSITHAVTAATGSAKPIVFGTPSQQFISCLILTLIWPLLPLGFEYFIKGEIKLDSITLAASMYAVGIGFSSKRIDLFCVALLQGFIFCLFYGLAQNSGSPPHPSIIFRASVVGMLIMFLFHASERYNRHVRLLEPFPDFLK
jgi:hypothetical protein